MEIDGKEEDGQKEIWSGTELTVKILYVKFIKSHKSLNIFNINLVLQEMQNNARMAILCLRTGLFYIYFIFKL